MIWELYDCMTFLGGWGGVYSSTVALISSECERARNVLQKILENLLPICAAVHSDFHFSTHDSDMTQTQVFN